MKLLIKLFPEIVIKSRPVRLRFIRRLFDNIICHLKASWFEGFKLSKSWDKIELVCSDDIVDWIIPCLQSVFWIQYILETDEFSFKTQGQIADKVVTLSEWSEFNWTFVVRVRRSWIHDFTSVDLERFVWSELLSSVSWLKVDLHNPQKLVEIEIKDNTCFIITRRHKWAWWFPVWAQEKVLTMISWWFDSPVAAYQVMKRGAVVDYLFFNLWWAKHLNYVTRIVSVLSKKYWVSYKPKLLVVDFTPVVKELLTNVLESYRWVVLKYLMFSIASRIQRKSKYAAVITWESIWQVSSQTIINLREISNVWDINILRPLIAFDKQDIINISTRIWLYDLSASVPEYCAISAKKPTTRANRSLLSEQVNLLSDDIIETAFREMKVDTILDKDIINSSTDWVESVNTVKNNDVVIDIRMSEVVKGKPLNIDKWQLRLIPFVKLVDNLAKLDKRLDYLLYCDHWVLSFDYATIMKSQWFMSVKLLKIA